MPLITNAASQLSTPTIASRGDNHYVVVWQEPNGSDLKACVMTSTGGLIEDVFRVNETAGPVATVSGDFGRPGFRGRLA
jgi:hypothetical protein